ncbi:MAG: ComF family protein [Muribaculaceae bacterium]|nr:ComF family protein [Muribaculaceae bacterium]
MKIKDIGNSLLDLFFPRTCPVCNRTLASHEKHICTECMLDIPRTNFHLQDFNAMEQLFAGKVPIEKAAGYFYYEKGNPYSGILHRMKYHNMPQIGRYTAALYAKELISCKTFFGIDCIIPVPLHRHKLISRGYNQSEYIAAGFADIFKIPIYSDIIIATKSHESQTHKGIYERWLNTQGIFSARNTEILKDKHVLIVDDVVTTGATLLSAALTISGIPGIKISLATLGVARLE